MPAPYNSQEHYVGQEIRERMVDLDFKEEFIEKMLKEYSVKKIEEKLDLLTERKNIQRPVGWLMAALKHDYRDTEQESYDEEPAEGSDNPEFTPEWTLREEALKAIKLIQDNLSACISPINERRFKCPN